MLSTTSATRTPAAVAFLLSEVSDALPGSLLVSMVTPAAAAQCAALVTWAGVRA
jgi:hypothetical protein